MKKNDIKKYLSPSDRLTEIITSIIMTMAVIGATRIGIGANNNNFHVIFYAAIGCDIAWGMIDAVLYIFSELMDRGRHALFLKSVQAIQDKDKAIEFITKKVEEEMDPAILEHFNHEDRIQLSQKVVQFSSKMTPVNVHISKDDVFGAISIFVVVICTGLVLLIPFVLFSGDITFASRISEIIALILLFLIGYRWAKTTNRPKIQTGIIMALLGVVIDVIVILLGG
jgi:VIT1/CCC1 family predicted Fe2+/Mn2+ transporter